MKFEPSKKEPSGEPQKPFSPPPVDPSAGIAKEPVPVVTPPPSVPSPVVAVPIIQPPPPVPPPVAASEMSPPEIASPATAQETAPEIGEQPPLEEGGEAPPTKMQYSPDMDWTVLTPSMLNINDTVFFDYAGDSANKAEVSRFDRAVATDLTVVLREFINLSTFYGLSSATVAIVEELTAAGYPAPEAIARANYTTALILAGVIDYSLNLNVQLARVPETEEIIELPVSPLHLFAFHFCAMTLKTHLVPQAASAGGLFFGSVEVVQGACDRLIQILGTAASAFDGENHPSRNIGSVVLGGNVFAGIEPTDEGEAPAAPEAPPSAEPTG